MSSLRCSTTAFASDDANAVGTFRETRKLSRASPSAFVVPEGPAGAVGSCGERERRRPEGPAARSGERERPRSRNCDRSRSLSRNPCERKHTVVRRGDRQLQGSKEHTKNRRAEMIQTAPANATSGEAATSACLLVCRRTADAQPAPLERQPRRRARPRQLCRRRPGPSGAVLAARPSPPRADG